MRIHLMGRSIQIPAQVLAGLQVADKPCLKKHSKMWRRWIKRGFVFKGGAAKRWAFLKDIPPV